MTIEEIAARDTQTGRLCRELSSPPGLWVTGPWLTKAAHTNGLSRTVGELRKLLPPGWVIENRLEQVKGERTKLSYYRLRKNGEVADDD